MSAMNKDYWTAIRLTSGSYGDAINLVANEQTDCLSSRDCSSCVVGSCVRCRLPEMTRQPVTVWGTDTARFTTCDGMGDIFHVSTHFGAVSRRWPRLGYECTYYCYCMALYWLAGQEL